MQMNFALWYSDNPNSSLQAEEKCAILKVFFLKNPFLGVNYLGEQPLC